MKYSNLRKPKSEIHKKHISDGLKGRVFTEEHRKNLSNARKGKHYPKVSLARLNKTYKEIVGEEKANEWKRRIGLGAKHPSSEEKKTKIGIAQKKVWDSGNRKVKSYPDNLYPDYGMRRKKHSEETKNKISITQSDGRWKLEKNPAWQNGKSFEPYGIGFSETLKKLVRERDNYFCFICSKPARIVHHIDYNKENNKMENLITLCGRCHSKTNHNREKWMEFFKSKTII